MIDLRIVSKRNSRCSTGPANMKLSFFCLLVSSALIVQISSQEVSELEHVVKNIFHSVYHILKMPLLELENTAPGRSLKNNIKMLLYGYSINGEWMAKELNKFLNDNLLTPEMKTFKNNLVKSLSSIMSLKNQTMAIPMDLLNESLDQFPDDIQHKILGIGHDIDDLLKQLKEKYVDNREPKKTKNST